MTILETAKKHFAQRQDLLGPIPVPEWETEIYYRVPNMQTRHEMALALSSGGLDGLVTVLILMARDAEGKLLFNKAQAPEFLRSVDPDVISRVATQFDVNQVDAGE